jgi:hypothetical protein
MLVVFSEEYQADILHRPASSSDPPETKISFGGDMYFIDKILQKIYDEILEAHRRLEVNGPLLEDRPKQRNLLRERTW